MRRIIENFFWLVIIMFLVLSCNIERYPSNLENSGISKNNRSINVDSLFEISVLKWSEGHTAAVSITYDAAWGMKDDEYRSNLQQVVDEILNRNMRLDFECVTVLYDKPDCQKWLEQMRLELIPNGIHFFGHGHLHIKYDEVSYDSAFILFKKCYDLMTGWQLNPKAYAYPHASCSKTSTRKANQDAGWLCARTMEFDGNKLLICPGNIMEPVDWFNLPSVSMANDYETYYQNHNEVLPVFEKALEQKAWIILTYHNIGRPGNWGWYSWDEFIKDIDWLKENDFWYANMDEVACYIKERNGIRIEYRFLDKKDSYYRYQLRFNDELDRTIYDQPLTLELNFDPSASTDSITVYPACYGQNKKFVVNNNQVRLKILPGKEDYEMTVYLKN